MRFDNGEFTVLPDEYNDYCYNWLINQDNKDRKRLNYIFFPHYDESRSQGYSDDEFIETMNDVSNCLEIKPKNIDDFIGLINGIEIIGNIYQNPELLNPLSSSNKEEVNK